MTQLSSDRPLVSNLLRPSMLAWRAKYLAEKAAQTDKPKNLPPKPPVPHAPPPR